MTAAEWNEVPSEIQNVIEALGIGLSGADLDQLGKAIAGYVANGSFYTDSGAANAYVLTAIGSKQSPTAYTDGMRATFRAGNTNTGASTVNVATLGVKNIFRNGAAVAAGNIASGVVIDLVYSTANGRFDQVVPAGGAVVTSGTPYTLSSYAVNTDATTAHGLGVTPSYIKARLICTTADAGWSVGDEVDVSSTMVTGTTVGAGFTIGCDGTNVYTSTDSTNEPSIQHKTTGVDASITAASWDLVVTPYAFT